MNEKLGEIQDLMVQRGGEDRHDQKFGAPKSGDQKSEIFEIWPLLDSRDVMFAFLELVESSFGNMDDIDKLKILVRLINPILEKSLPKFKAQNNNLTVYETFDIVSSMIKTWIEPVVKNPETYTSLNRHFLLQLYRLTKTIITHASDQLPTNTPKFKILMKLVNLSAVKNTSFFYKDNLVRCYAQEVMCLLIEKIVPGEENENNNSYSAFKNLCPAWKFGQFWTF